MKPPENRSIARVALRWVIIAGVMFVLLVGTMVVFEEKLIFIPTTAAQDWQDGGEDIEDVWFEADDGTRLHAWLLEHEDPRAVVLFAHGNAGNISHRLHVIRWLRDKLRVSVMAFDYRGYGRSEGTPNEEGVLADARAARRCVADKCDVEEVEVVLLGRSLGGGVMVDLAATDGARALILENTFSSLPDVGATIYPWLPVRMLMRTKLDSKSKIADYQGPLLQSHGEVDRIIPIRLGKSLFENANEPKTWITLKGRDHNDGHPPEYERALDQFFDSLP